MMPFLHEVPKLSYILRHVPKISFFDSFSSPPFSERSKTLQYQFPKVNTGHNCYTYLGTNFP